MKNRTRARFAYFLLLTLALFFFTSANPEDTVYVTNSGRMYHLDGCSSLRVSRIAVTLLEAARSGYGACSICRPPVLDLSSYVFNHNDNPLYRVNQAGLRSSASADLSRMLGAQVVGHVDGDTVRVRITDPPEGLNLIETIRLLGVDTPETVHPSREVEFFGQEASNFTRNTLYGQWVYLAFDWDLRDRYGRLLAYIYLEGGQCFNALLIREGYSHAYTAFAFQFIDEFRALEQEARQARRGLWANR